MDSDGSGATCYAPLGDPELQFVAINDLTDAKMLGLSIEVRLGARHVERKCRSQG